MQYEGNPAKFEKTFGFPMYKDGDLNYDRLLLDLYATTDKSNINIGKNGLPEGTTEKTRNQIINNYLNSKGVHVTTDYHADVNANNYREIVEKIIIPEYQRLEIYFKGLPFGFIVKYTTHRASAKRSFTVNIDSCELDY